MCAPDPLRYRDSMRLKWSELANARRYRLNTDAGRRMLELRYALAVAVRAKRKQLNLTQHDLAWRMRATQATVSRMERPLSTVSLDQIVYALLVMGADDTEVARAFRASEVVGVQKVRERASLRLYVKPARVVDGRYPHAKQHHSDGLMGYAQGNRHGVDQREHAQQILQQHDGYQRDGPAS